MILVDTHAWIWLLGNEPRLGSQARERIEFAVAREAMAISAITPWEVALLVSKGRLSLGASLDTWMTEAVALDGTVVLPIEPSIAVQSVSLPGTFHADPADRFIVATAREHDIPVVTVDRAILAYAAEGHVRVIDAGM